MEKNDGNRVILELDSIDVRYPHTTRNTLEDVCLQVRAGSRTAVVGESGSGKSTLMRTILGLLSPSAGTVRWFGEDIARLPSSRLARLRARVQPVFQDPISSFDPRYDCRQVLEEPLIVHGWRDSDARRERCRRVLCEVGLPEDVLKFHPRRLSGGQRQRLAIARAMILSPEALVADEPTAALDLSVQGQVAKLLLDLHREAGLALLVISHDFPLVAQLCDRVAVLYAGRIVEEGPLEQVFSGPMHPYSRDLVDAATGDLPPPDAPLPSSPSATGCPYRLRCRLALDCCMEMPQMRAAGDWKVACHLAQLP